MPQKQRSTDSNGFALFSSNFTFSGWKDFMKKLLGQISEDNVVIVSGGVAFFFFLALFPAITGIISIYGLVSNPEQIQDQLTQLASIFPVEAEEFITKRLKKMVTQPDKNQGWQLAGSIFLSIWVANIGTRALFKGVSIAYNGDYKRSFLNENKVTLLFTIGGVFLNIIMIAFLVGFPAVAEQLGFEKLFDTILKWAQWPVLAIIIALALALVYKFAPYKRPSKFAHAIRGAALASVLWIFGSWLLSFMLRKFGIFSQPYGSSLAIIFLMLWCLLISFIILVGAEMNSLLEESHTDKEET